MGVSSKAALKYPLPGARRKRKKRRAGGESAGLTVRP